MFCHRRGRRGTSGGNRSVRGRRFGRALSESLLGKAHTVMAEGGMAAAIGNVDDRDNWKVHFTDTMRGGQYVNNWRMAELHAKEAPDRVLEFDAGARFLIGRKTDAFCKEISADINIRDSRMSATGLDWR